MRQAINYRRSALGCGLVLAMICAGCNQPDASKGIEQEAVHVQARESFLLTDADNWLIRTPELWQVVGEPGRRYLQLNSPKAARGMLPGPRRPQEYALYTPHEFRSFALSCFVRVDAGHAAMGDICIIFGRQDASHLYYVQLSGASDVARDAIVRVSGSTSQSLIPAGSRRKPIIADREWHKIDVLRDANSGSIQVFVDAHDEKTSRPYLQATDTSYEWGFVGLGSFDRTVSFARILIEGQGREPIAAATLDDSTSISDQR